MGPFHMQLQLYYCPVTLSKILCQQTFADFFEKCLKFISLFPLSLCLKLFV